MIRSLSRNPLITLFIFIFHLFTIHELVCQTCQQLPVSHSTKCWHRRDLGGKWRHTLWTTIGCRSRSSLAYGRTRCRPSYDQIFWSRYYWPKTPARLHRFLNRSLIHIFGFLLAISRKALSFWMSIHQRWNVGVVLLLTRCLRGGHQQTWQLEQGTWRFRKILDIAGDLADLEYLNFLYTQFWLICLILPCYQVDHNKSYKVFSTLAQLSRHQW